MSVKKAKTNSEVAYLISRSADVFMYFHNRKRGRPPKLNREHLESILILCKTLLDDMHECLDYMLPDLQQVHDLLRVFDYLNSIKRRYIDRVGYLKKYGLIPDADFEVKDE